MKNIFILFLILTATLFSCQENEFEAIPIEFEFLLLNEQEIPSLDFNVGENIIFNFLIVNKSTEIITFHDILEREDFMRVFAISNQSENKDQFIDLGKPYENFNCEFILGRDIQPQGIFKLQIPWQPDSTDIYSSRIFCNIKNGPDLNAGVYFTEFKSAIVISIKGEQVIIPEQNFKIEFNIN